MSSIVQAEPRPGGSPDPAAMRYVLDVEVTRGPLVEQEHLIHAAVVDAGGRLVGAARDPHVWADWRSCAKPFQQIPFVEAGGPKRLRWGPEYLALTCGSHLGEPRHVDLVRLMLRSLGADEEDLVCGATEPQSENGEAYLEKASRPPGRIHNPCSGKHAAMIACCALHEWEVAGYHLPGHPLQQEILGSISEWTDLPREQIVVATDGCGVPGIRAAARPDGARLCAPGQPHAPYRRWLRTSSWRRSRSAPSSWAARRRSTASSSRPPTAT